jgi:hypothetical protein
MSLSPALREIVQAEDPLLDALPDWEPTFTPLPARPAARLPRYEMRCSCGLVWETTDPHRDPGFCEDYSIKTGKRVPGLGCGKRLPAPVPEIRGEA